MALESSDLLRAVVEPPV